MKQLLLLIILSLSLSLFGQPPSYVPTNSLIAWWPFNGNANDESGNGHNGIESGGVLLTTDRMGSSNSAFFFDGIDDVITVPDDNALDVQVGSFSISLWVLTYGNRQYINKALDANQSEGYFIASNGAGEVLTGVSYGSGQSSYQIGSSSIYDSIWHHIVMVYDIPTSYDVYIDGELDNGMGSINTPPTLNGNNLDLRFGASASGFFFSSTIDDIGIWSRALDSCEIKELYTTQNCIVGIEELTSDKVELLQIVDFMGRETEFKPNTPLIYIYSDGTRKRIIKIEY